MHIVRSLLIVASVALLTVPAHAGWNPFARKARPIRGRRGKAQGDRPARAPREKDQALAAAQKSLRGKKGKKNGEKREVGGYTFKWNGKTKRWQHVRDGESTTPTAKKAARKKAAAPSESGNAAAVLASIVKEFEAAPLADDVRSLLTGYLGPQRFGKDAVVARAVGEVGPAENGVTTRTFSYGEKAKVIQRAGEVDGVAGEETLVVWQDGETKLRVVRHGNVHTVTTPKQGAGELTQVIAMAASSAGGGELARSKEFTGAIFDREAVADVADRVATIVGNGYSITESKLNTAFEGTFEAAEARDAEDRTR